MTRLTGNDALGLMEAYNAVYIPQELTEEQIQEDFENWVYSFVNEGYDLSEYTWGDMYEIYMNETVNPATSQELNRAAALSTSAGRNREFGGPIRRALGTSTQEVQAPRGGRPGTVIKRQQRPFGPHVVDPSSWKPTYSKPTPVGGGMTAYEHVDQYDLILGHLLDEGYADTEEDALVIMSNMSEEWKQTIIESF